MIQQPGLDFVELNRSWILCWVLDIQTLEQYPRIVMCRVESGTKLGRYGQSFVLHYGWKRKRDNSLNPPHQKTHFVHPTRKFKFPVLMFVGNPCLGWACRFTSVFYWQARISLTQFPYCFQLNQHHHGTVFSSSRVPRQRAGIPRSTAHLRVGIIGAGGNTQDKHIPKLQDIPGVKVVAVANRSVGSAEKVCQLFDIPKGTGNWRDIIEDDSIDAVVIGTWPYLHKTLVLEALQAGKHVLTEARLAMNAREARELYEASLHHPHLVTQVVPSPFTLAMDATIAHFIADKLLGDLIHIDVVAVSGQFPDDSTALSWRQDIQYSGMNVMTLGIFYEPLLRWVGPAQKVQAMGKAYVKLRKDAETGQPHVVQVPDHLNVLAEMAIGAHAHFLISNVMGGLMPGQRKQMYSIYGSLGTLHVDIENRRLSFSHKSVEDGELKEIPWADAPGAGWRVEDEFIGAIRGTEKVHRTDFYTGVQYMEFTEAVFRSCQSGQPVSLPLVD
eukprot:jgi/Botrbrau1/21874/Bobra.0249s0004.2